MRIVLEAFFSQYNHSCTPQVQYACGGRALCVRFQVFLSAKLFNSSMCTRGDCSEEKLFNGLCQWEQPRWGGIVSGHTLAVSLGNNNNTLEV